MDYNAMNCACLHKEAIMHIWDRLECGSDFRKLRKSLSKIIWEAVNSKAVDCGLKTAPIAPTKVLAAKKGVVSKSCYTVLTGSRHFFVNAMVFIDEDFGKRIVIDVYQI